MHIDDCSTENEREVRFWKGWWSDNPSGSRPNFFGRQHLTFNKGGKCGGAKQGLVQAKDGGEAIPPVVARIFSGDSTSPLTREASVMVQSKG